MGTINHDSLIIIADDMADAAAILKKWDESRFDLNIVTATVAHIHMIPVNGGVQLHFGSSGSKDGWGPAEDLRSCYRHLISLMEQTPGRYRYAWIQFGDDPVNVVADN